MSAESGKPRVAVFASGGGTNLQCLIDAAAGPDYPARIALVLSNNADAYCLQRATIAGIPSAVIDHRDFADRPSFEAVVHKTLLRHAIDYICLAGFMRVLTGGFVARWHDRMLNIHPSLLPKYKGLETHRRALEAGDLIAGATVHLVRPALDDGPLLLQAEVPIREGDTPESLAERVLLREHEIYPKALAMLAEKRIVVNGTRAVLNGVEGPIRLPTKSDAG